MCGLVVMMSVEGGLCDPDVKSESGYFRIDGSKNLNCESSR
jgi:hypothetical protein